MKFGRIKFVFCHRIPERTLKIRNFYFPVCARCTGIYIGYFAFFIFFLLFYVQSSYTMIFIAFGMMIPTFLDGITQFFGFRESNNTLRFSTGLIAGVGLGILIFFMI